MQQRLHDMASPVRIHSLVWTRGELNSARSQREPASVTMQLRAPPPSDASVAAMAAGRVLFQDRWLFPPSTTPQDLELDPHSGAPLLHHGTSFENAVAILRSGRLAAKPGRCPEGVYATGSADECRYYVAGAVFKFASYGILSSKATGKVFRDADRVAVPEGLIVQIGRSQLERVSNPASTELRSVTVPLFALAHYLRQSHAGSAPVPPPPPAASAASSSSGGRALGSPGTELRDAGLADERGRTSSSGNSSSRSSPSHPGAVRRRTRSPAPAAAAAGASHRRWGRSPSSSRAGPYARACGTSRTTRPRE